MKTLLTISLFFWTVIAFGQISRLEACKAVNDSIIARYNRNDFEGIYNLGNEWFSTYIDKEYCLTRFRENRSVTGEIFKTFLTDESGPVKHFTWVGEKKNIDLELRVEDGKMKLFDISDFVVQTDVPEGTVLTDNPLKSQLDSIVHKNALIYASDKQFVGLSIGVFKDGKRVVYNYGERKRHSGVLPDSNSIYQIGSVAKTFVGILLSQAVVEKKIKLDDDIRNYLKDDFPNLQYKGQPIKVRDLANHTGGFNKFNLIEFPKDFDSLDSRSQNNFFYSYPTKRYLEDWRKLTLDTIPGTNYSYSLGGIILLKMALENVYGRPLHKLVTDYFGQTFAMNETKLIVPESDLYRFALPHDQNGNTIEPMLKSTASIFTIKSTPSDMLKYVEANVVENELSILLSHRPTYGDMRWFALGLTWMMNDNWERGLHIFHSGHDAGYNSLCAMYPHVKLGFVLLSNEDGRQGELFNLEKRIFQNLEKR
ncbi:MAG TPA: serine hydrolase domain-containing protein [Pseudosphingobacterium sp.]|nr:serine hydrolase domain-containing protein [Pseudosphingobacterium sp.]